MHDAVGARRGGGGGRALGGERRPSRSAPLDHLFLDAELRTISLSTRARARGFGARAERGGGRFACDLEKRQVLAVQRLLPGRPLSTC